MAETILHLALAALTALGWLGLGTVALVTLPRSGDAALDLLNRFGAGAATFALLTFAAGWLHLLYRWPYRAGLVACAVVGARALGGVRLRLPRAWPRWQLALLALLGVFLVVDALATAAPISSADALYHHAAAPKLFVEHHRIVELPWAWNSYQPYTVEMLITDGFLLWNAVQGAFAPLLLAFGAFAALTLGAARIFGRIVGLLAGAVLLADAYTTWAATSTFVEPGTMLFIALAAWNVVDYVRRGRTPSLVLAGLFAGACAGTKYPAAGSVVVLTAAAAVLLRERLDRRAVLAFALPAVAVAAPWYVKNWIVTDNPVYPFVFGGANAEADRAYAATRDVYGFGTSPLDLVLLPFRMLVDAGKFDRGEFVSPLFLLFAPLAFLQPRLRPIAAALWVAAAAITLAWFFNVQDLRYLAVLAPFFAVLAAVGIVALASRGRLGRLVSAAVVAAALASATAISFVYATQFASVVAGRESTEQFLREKAPYYEGTEWMNEHLPRDAHVAVGHILNLYLDRPYVSWTSDVLPTTAGPTATRAFARRWRLSYAAVLQSNELSRARQLEYLRAKLIARVTVHPILSRTRNELGPRDTLLIYRLAT